MLRPDQMPIDPTEARRSYEYVHVYQDPQGTAHVIGIIDAPESHSLHTLRNAGRTIHEGRLSAESGKWKLTLEGAPDAEPASIRISQEVRAHLHTDLLRQVESSPFITALHNTLGTLAKAVGIRR